LESHIKVKDIELDILKEENKKLKQMDTNFKLHKKIAIKMVREVVFVVDYVSNPK